MSELPVPSLNKLNPMIMGGGCIFGFLMTCCIISLCTPGLILQQSNFKKNNNTIRLYDVAPCTCAASLLIIIIYTLVIYYLNNHHYKCV